MTPEAGRREKLLWGVIGLLVLIVAAFYGWRVLAVRGVESRFDEMRTAWGVETRRALEARTMELLRLSSLPLGFAVREAVLDGDMGAVDAYLERLVAEPGVEGAVYADAEGAVRVATDQALVGRPLAEVYPRLDFATDRADVVVQVDRYHAVVPITGINERLGVLVLTYTPDRADREETAAR